MISPDQIFVAGPGELPAPGRIVARDGRSAAWMACGYSLATGRAVTVVTTSAWDFAQAAAAAFAPVRIEQRDGALEVAAHVETSAPEHHGSPDIFEPDVAGWAAIPSRPPAVERLAAVVAALLPHGSLLCVEPSCRAAAAAVTACSARADVRVLRGPAGGARGAAIAMAVGAKAACPERTIAVVCDAGAMAVGGGDLEPAGRAGLPVAVIVANDAPDAPVYDALAILAGGHGELVDDPARLELHVRNALAATMPAVVNVVVAPSRPPGVTGAGGVAGVGQLRA